MAQKLNPNRSDNRGGSRENAGRKPNEIKKKPIYFRLTESEEKKVREFIISLKCK